VDSATVAIPGFYVFQNADLEGPTNSTTSVGEPDHWHADYKLNVCGSEKVLQNGPTKAHTHGEKTFHMEGVRSTREEATLEWIVDSLGGQMENNSVMGKENCDGEPADLKVKVNNERINDPLNYIPKDGDFININYG